MSLRNKLLIFSIILALIPIGFAGKEMIRITRDELISSANDKLLTVANKVSLDIDGFIRSDLLWMVKKAVETEELGINEKVSLMTEAMKNETDFVAFQISVKGFASPLIVTQDEFSDKLKQSSADPVSILKVVPEKIASLQKDEEIFVGDLTYIKEVKAWLVTAILPMKVTGLDAAFSARINMGSFIKSISEDSSTHKVFITLVDSKGHKIFDPESSDISQFDLVKTVKKVLSSKTRTGGVETYVRPSGQEMLGAYAFSHTLDWGIIVEQYKSNAYMAVAQMRQSLIFWLIIGFSIAVVGAVVVSVSLTRPLQRLTKAARKIAQGDLSVRIEEKVPRDEIGELSRTFNHMVSELREYIDKLTETTKAKERAESELKLAWNIQQSFLPKNFPKLKEIDVWGKCDPAREVGGDYFDFFKIDNENYGMVIGDVSGKGAQAALFMAVSRTLFRILSAQEYSPELVLTKFNDQLVALDQGANMFITVFYGVFNIKTSVLCYSSAGHNMPYIKSSESNGTFQMLPAMKTMVAGMMDGIPMELAETHMHHGDIVVLYTDGMTEAINEEDEEFGEERLEELLNRYSNLSAKDMCNSLIQDVQVFQGTKPQFDDMTMFILKVNSPASA
ncbi:MAG: SpoIIE family protein phosphatase [Desulfobacteraceae bacterium]|nr:SpoIIE family protein phosphatase [Desulfobacteraceae bacterium]